MLSRSLGCKWPNSILLKPEKMNALSQVTVPERVNVRLNYSQILHTVSTEISLFTPLSSGMA